MIPLDWFWAILTNAPFRPPALLYKQYVSCPTQNGSTLDLCYGNIANAYKSPPLPPIGLSDHNTVLLTPKYRSKLKTSKPTTNAVNLWTEKTTQVLQDCLDTTDWDMFKEKTRDIHEVTDTISCYLHFCANNVITSKEIKC